MRDELEGAMPWKASRPVDLRIEFITRMHRGERMSDLCREYGISRKTGHKIKKRFEKSGTMGLLDESRAPKHIPHKTAPAVVELVVAERKRHPSWGAKKLKDVLEKRLGHTLPAASTLGDILTRRGLVHPRHRRARHSSAPTGLRTAHSPNDTWCVDYKGQFRLGDGSYCYPLTVTDQVSRFLLGCEGMPAISDEAAREVFEDLFETYGLPLAMRSDNGVPFASTGLAGLTRLSAYWLRLGIVLERIRPGHPEENGRHERMHRTLKRETARPARSNLLQQQESFDSFLQEFNHDRPHEALGMKRPAEIYAPSPRRCPTKLPEPTYPTHDDAVTVDRWGHIFSARRRVYLSSALAGQTVGVREEDDGRWLVTFMDLDLGFVGRNHSFTPATSPGGELDAARRCPPSPQPGPQVVSLPPKPTRIAT
jgi:transposase InsO family protein